MNNFMCFSVGEQITSPSVDSVRFDLTSSGSELVLQLGKPTAKEKNDFKNGVPQFALKVVNDIIFILSRFGTGPWMDAPYYRYRSKPYELSMPTSPNEGINMHAMLVDARTGVLVAQRFIGLEHDLSVKLMEAVASQPQIPDYDWRLKQVFNTMSTLQILEMTDDNQRNL